MKLSACLIVKNEEDVIERCLDSIIHHVDEVIVVDTGSTDHTQGILSSYAEAYTNTDKFEWVYREWNGSFADMRNKSMDLATGDVLFIIDADEYVEDQDWDQVRQAINMPDFIVGMIQVMNKTTQGPVRGERVMQPRLFLNHPDIRYKYAIHNQIDDSYLSYANKFKEEHGRQALIVGMSFEIIHTGYQLTIEECKVKYAHRAEICRSEVEKAIENGSARDEAYYKYQLALFLTMIEGGDESYEMWDDIDYSSLNVFNRWYAKYIAARAMLKKAEATGDIEDLYKALSFASGMFEAMSAEQSGYMTVPEEPASWMIAGVIMLEVARKADIEDLRREGLVMMIEAFLRSLTPPQGMRCVIDSRKLYHDIKIQFDEGSTERYMLDTEDLKEGVSAIRKLQRALMPFDESLLELEDREYL